MPPPTRVHTDRRNEITEREERERLRQEIIDYQEGQKNANHTNGSTGR